MAKVILFPLNTLTCICLTETRARALYTTQPYTREPNLTHGRVSGCLYSVATRYNPATLRQLLAFEQLPNCVSLQELLPKSIIQSVTEIRVHVSRGERPYTKTSEMYYTNVLYTLVFELRIKETVRNTSCLETCYCVSYIELSRLKIPGVPRIVSHPFCIVSRWLCASVGLYYLLFESILNHSSSIAYSCEVILSIFRINFESFLVDRVQLRDNIIYFSNPRLQLEGYIIYPFFEPSSTSGRLYYLVFESILYRYSLMVHSWKNDFWIIGNVIDTSRDF